MNTLLGIVNCPLTHQIGWALLHSLWQGACVGAVFALLRFALRRFSANARYLAGCLSLGVLLAAPVLTMLIGPTPSAAPGSGASRISTLPGADASVLDLSGLQRLSNGTGSYSLGHWGADFFTQVAPLLAAVWLLGVIFFSARLTKGCCWVRNIRTRATEPVEAAWMEMLDDLRCRLGVSRPVRLLKSALVEVPTVIGWFRPVILLPAATLSGLSPRQVEAILAHELAHVRRLDYVVNAFQCLVETLMFYHPVVWWISRHVREERENCCDDLVIQVCGDRVGYARALATMEGLRGGVLELAFAASGDSLLSRIRRLLGASSESGPVSARQVGGLALLGIGLVLIILGVCLAVAPTNYRSTTRIKIERDQSDGVSNPQGNPGYDPYFIQTEFELIQSEVILAKVIEALDLNKEWGNKYAHGDRLKTSETIGLLKARIDLRPVRGINNIDLRVFSEKAAEAARIANAIAETYTAHRREQRSQLSKGGIKLLEEGFARMGEKVKKAQQQVDALRGQLSRINETSGRTESPAPQVGKSNQNRAYVEAKRSLEELQRFRQILEAKIATENIDVSVEKTGMVEIVDKAVPARRPISPNLPRALALMALGVLLDMAGLVMLQGWSRTDSARRFP